MQPVGATEAECWRSAWRSSSKTERHSGIVVSWYSFADHWGYD